MGEIRVHREQDHIRIGYDAGDELVIKVYLDEEHIKNRDMRIFAIENAVYRLAKKITDTDLSLEQRVNTILKKVIKECDF